MKNDSSAKKPFSVKKWCMILLIGLLLLFIFYHLFGPFVANVFYSMGDDLAEYKRTAFVGWLADEPYVVFPDEAFVRNAVHYDYQFHCEKFPILFLLYDNDALAFLKCTYTEEDYAEEISRLERTCGAVNAAAFSFPGYTYHTPHKGFFMQYALVIPNDHTICYFALQNMSYAKKYVSSEFLPKSWNQSYSQSGDGSLIDGLIFKEGG